MTELSSTAEGERELLYLAEAALVAPLPLGWGQGEDGEGRCLFLRLDSGGDVWQYDHPLLPHFKKLVGKQRRMRAERAMRARRSSGSSLGRRSSSGSVGGLKRSDSNGSLGSAGGLQRRDSNGSVGDSGECRRTRSLYISLPLRPRRHSRARERFCVNAERRAFQWPSLAVPPSLL